MVRKIRNLFTVMIACLLAVFAAGTISYGASGPELSFSDSGIAETVSGSGYSIDGTTLTISGAGTYTLSGSCSNGSIVVAKGVKDVVLVFKGLSLTSDSTAPLVIKKKSEVSIQLYEGTESVLTDAEDPANETSSDADVQDAFEGACIKVKSGSSLTFSGEGKLTCDGSSCKNAVKGGSTSSLVFNGGTYVIKAANNGIAADGSVTINDGDFDIDADNDGIKSTPDATNADEGTTIDTDSAGTVTINGGSFDIDVLGDGIQADTLLLITGGTFDIKTMAGSATKGTKAVTYGSGISADTSKGTFDADTMSCKGLKASGDRAEEAGTTPDLQITGGTFVLDTADDAVHSDGYITVTGGSFSIKTGDDGMHADTTLELGTEGGSSASDPYVVISRSYEGLEGGTVYIYQGTFNVTAVDDGVNAAGGSDASGAEQNGRFNPGGGHGPGGNQGGQNTSTSDYNIYISGGNLYVNCSGDGLDSNGGLYLTGGTQEIFSQSSGDNTAIDADGTISIDGAEVFTAGAVPMMDPVRASWFGSSQKYQTYSGNISSGMTVKVSDNGNTVYSTRLPKAARYIMYSAPGLSGTPEITITATSESESEGESSGSDDESSSESSGSDGESSSGSSSSDGESSSENGSSTSEDEQSGTASGSGSDSGSGSSSGSGSESGSGSSSGSSTSESEQSGTTSGSGSDESTTAESSDTGSAFVSGTSVTELNKAVSNLTDDTDPEGASYAPLRFRSLTQTKAAIKLTWKKVSGAKKYIVYANKCGKKYKLKKVAVVSGNRNTYTVKKAAGAKLKKGTYYKLFLAAVDKDNKVISSSTIIHVATKGGKVTNNNKVTVKIKKGSKYKAVSRISLKTGKSQKLKAYQSKASSKLKVKKHVAVRYESSDTSIARVTRKGVVKAAGSGTCKIYVYTQSGAVKVINCKVS